MLYLISIKECSRIQSKLELKENIDYVFFQSNYYLTLIGAIKHLNYLKVKEEEILQKGKTGVSLEDMRSLIILNTNINHYEKTINSVTIAPTDIIEPSKEQLISKFQEFTNES